MPRSMFPTALGLALVIALSGCSKGNQSGSTETIPVGPPGGAAGPAGPPGPAGPAGAPGTMPPAGPNPALTAKVKNELMVKKVDTAHVTVDVTPDGTVMLIGSVPTANQKALAEKSAKAVPGVASVKNQLTVSP